MTVFITALLVFVLLLHYFPSLTKDPVKDTTLSYDERRMIKLKKFGFTDSGFVDIKTNYVALTAGSNASLFGFFLVSEEEGSVIDSQKEKNPSCVLDSESVSLVSRGLWSSNRLQDQRNIDKSYAVTRPGTYVLYFGNCNPPRSFVSMEVYIDMFNVVDKRTGTKSYLSVGLTPMRYVYLCFFIVYLCFLFYWLSSYDRHGYDPVLTLHLRMGAMLLWKALSMLCAAIGLQHVMVEWYPRGWGFLFMVSQLLWVTFVFVVTGTVANAWAFLKPFLDETVINDLMKVVTVQIFSVIASTVISNTYYPIDIGIFDDAWVWLIFLQVLDISCFLIIVTSITFWVMSLRKERFNDGNGGDKVAQKLSKANGFIKFYTLLFTCLYSIKLVFFFLKGIKSYKYQWVAISAQETLTLAIHFGSLYMFMLIEKKNKTLDFEEIHFGLFSMFRGLIEKKNKSLVCDQEDQMVTLEVQELV